MTPFRIQTLSANHRLSSRLGVDPTIIVTGGLTIAQQLFPNLFGTQRKPITDSDWNQLFPGGGYWSTLLKQYLKSRVHYDVDMKFLYPYEGGNGWSRGYIAQFVLEHRAQICPEQPGECWTGTICQKCMQQFEQILSKERMTGGREPGGLFPGATAGIDWQSLILIGGGVLLLVALSRGKKK